MKKAIFYLFILCSVLITSCATISETHFSSLVKDMGSPRKVDLLKKRASEFWGIMIKGDLKKAYIYYDPFLRARMSVEEFVEKHSAVRYHEFEITDVKVEGNVGTIKVKVKYSVPKLKVKRQEFSIPETKEEFEERWLFVYDNWYKEYYLRLFETGAAFY